MFNYVTLMSVTVSQLMPVILWYMCNKCTMVITANEEGMTVVLYISYC